MSLFQGLVAPVLALVAVLILVESSRRALPWRSGLLWSSLWFAAAMLITFPGATVFLARWLGVGRGADLVFYAATVGGLGVSLYFYRRCQRLEELLTDVIRREALRAARHGRADRDVPAAPATPPVVRPYTKVRQP